MTRQLTATALVLALSLSLLGCGGDDPADDATGAATATTAAAGGDPDGTGGTSTEDAPPDFAGQLAVAQAELASADSFCEVFSVVGQFETIAPTTADEMRLAIGHFIDLIRRLADTAPAELADEAATLRSSADAIEQEAGTSGYDPATLNTLPTLTDTSFQAAQQSMFTASSRC